MEREREIPLSDQGTGLGNIDAENVNIYTPGQTELAQKLVTHTYTTTHTHYMGPPTTHTCTNHKLTRVQTTNMSLTHMKHVDQFNLSKLNRLDEFL